MIRQSSELEIVVATHNAGKVREIQAALALLPIKLLNLNDFPNISSIDEIGQTYQENAVLKALGYAKQTGVCALADDSGLEVDALDGQPGVFSARFAGPNASDTERNEKLVAALSGYGPEDRNARFVCSMALAGWKLARQPIDRDEPELLKATVAKSGSNPNPCPPLGPGAMVPSLRVQEVDSGSGLIHFLCRKITTGPLASCLMK